MFWTFLIVIALATILVKLGAMAVLLALLIPAFKVALVIIVLLTALHIFRNYRRN